MTDYSDPAALARTAGEPSMNTVGAAGFEPATPCL